MIANTDGGRPLRWPGRLADLFIVAVAAAATVWLLNAFVVTRFRVEGESMFPALHSGDYVLVDRVAYRWSGLQRGDVIVFQYPYGPERDFIKRVIGLPGDVVEVAGGQVRVNDVVLDEPYIPVPAAYQEQIRLGPDQLYVLGDNRNNSIDSHTWGALDSRYLIGRAVVVYWPPSSARIVRHYPQPDIPIHEDLP